MKKFEKEKNLLFIFLALFKLIIALIFIHAWLRSSCHKRNLILDFRRKSITKSGNKIRIGNNYMQYNWTYSWRYS